MALNMSRIPFSEPVAAVRIGRIQGQWVLNPTFQQLDYSDVDIVVAGSENAITMVEGGSLEVPEEEIAEGLLVAHDGIRELIGIQREALAQVEIPAEMPWSAAEADVAIRESVGLLATARIKDAMQIADKQERVAALDTIRTDIAAQIAEETPEFEGSVSPMVKEIEKREMREMILTQGRRSDGRGLEDVRDITIDLGLLPRAHAIARRRDARHTSGRAAPGVGRLSDGADEELHAPLQLSSLLDGRGEADARYEPTRNRSWDTRGEGARGAPAGV